ncbi:MAG: hypothetical protein AAGA30_13340, partial [Planctomycetota bacterium]
YAKGKSIEESPELKILSGLGCQLIETRIPTSFPVQALASVIDIEAASVFDELLRQGHTEGWNSWTDTFKAAQFFSAIDYVRLMRLRTRLMHEFEEFMSDFDAIVNLFDVFHTNLTGHPSVVFPLEYKKIADEKFRPYHVTLTGHINKDDQLLAIAHQIQRVSKMELTKPPLDHWLTKFVKNELDSPPEPIKPKSN